jgi:hypothetical protein
MIGRATGSTFISVAWTPHSEIRGTCPETIDASAVVPSCEADPVMGRTIGRASHSLPGRPEIMCVRSSQRGILAGVASPTDAVEMHRSSEARFIVAPVGVICRDKRGAEEAGGCLCPPLDTGPWCWHGPVHGLDAGQGGVVFTLTHVQRILGVSTTYLFAWAISLRTPNRQPLRVPDLILLSMNYFGAGSRSPGSNSVDVRREISCKM